MAPTTVNAPPTAAVIRAFRAPEGCTAYLISDPAAREALVVDPRLDQVEEILEAAREAGVRIRDVVDTHTHADHLSGARRLAERAEAALLAPSGSRLQAPARRVGPGASFRVGDLEVRVLAAPGHTPDAVAFLAAGHLFTGDALFVEGVGRTDFPGGSPDELLDTLESFEALPDETVVHPGHDYQRLGDAPLARLRAEHPVLSLADRAARRERVAGKGLEIPDIRDFLAWNLAAAEPRPLPPRAAADLVRGRSAAFVDVRTPAEFAQARIEGSLLLPLHELENRLTELPDGRDVVLVCRTGRRAESAREILARSGRTGLVMEGGIEAWRAARLPLLEPRPGVLAIDRQVQLAAGSLIVTGTLLAALVSPWFLAIPGFVGAGLVFAGSTGTCGLARLLGALPWNRPAPVSDSAPAPSCSAGACSAGGAGK